MDNRIILVLLSISLFACIEPAAGKPPHIVFIVADDLGWNDVGFYNPLIKSPNIDKLAYGGMIMNQSYVQPVCSPRVTGLSNYQLKMYNDDVQQRTYSYIDLINKAPKGFDDLLVGNNLSNYQIEMSRNSFMTGIYPFKSGLQHSVIMAQQPACAPLNQTFLPVKLKELGYSTHIIGKWHLGFCKWECTPTYRGFDTFYGYYNANEDYYNYTVGGGFDFRDGKTATKPNVYSTYAYAKRADEVLASHNKSQPLFLYLPFQSVHEPIQVPQNYEDMYKNIKNKGRRQFSGMVTALDDAIGNVTQSLIKYGLYEETLIIFTTDNGGWTIFSGNNYPLRGGKLTVYEGGTRAVQFVHGAGISKKNYIFNGMMHAVDWMPTILAAAGGGNVSGIDGINHWPDLQDGIPRSRRTEFIYNLDDSLVPVNGKAAIRMGDYKLIEGFAGTYNGWYPPAQLPEDPVITEIDPMSPNVEEYQLYDLMRDPNERNNLYNKESEIFKKLKARLDEYKKDIVPPLDPKNSAASNPKNYNGYWTPGWC